MRNELLLGSGVGLERQPDPSGGGAVVCSAWRRQSSLLDGAVGTESYLVDGIDGRS